MKAGLTDIGRWMVAAALAAGASLAYGASGWFHGGGPAHGREDIGAWHASSRDIYRGEMTRYTGPITEVSAEGRPGGAGNNALVRGGSIREDVARYNEERSVRPLPRRTEEMSSPPPPSPYRN